MQQLFAEIPQSEAVQSFEDRLMEMEVPSWTIHEDRIKKTLALIGYFESEDEGLASYGKIRAVFPFLPEKPITVPVADRNWKEAYKEHFRPWCHEGLHWVPEWLRQQYPLPRGDKAIYLDPGMAFGTGNHETTRLCAIRLVEAAKEWEGNLFQRSVIDAGCGSGILAISAQKMGFGSVSGFDIDAAAVKIAEENAAINHMEGRIQWSTADVAAGLKGRQADLVMANILANVLIQNMTTLINSVLPGGRLVLSGILAREIDEVKTVYENGARTLWRVYECKSRIEGEWADLLLCRI
jgi:ribosomal protein L11 methyltransferase